MQVSHKRGITFNMKRAAPPSGSQSRTNAALFQDIKPEYYFENDLRKVRPYYFEYQTYAKERWLGRSILDVFLKEFRDRPARYYNMAIERDLITINGEPCGLEQIVKSSDLIGHKLHRHEPPVTAQEIKVLHRNEGLLVIDKPASIPAHPSGRYRFNTIVEILRNELGIKHLSIINRLDRLTSGICILATDPKAAEHLHQQMEGRGFEKEYIARVVGKFPLTSECKEPLRCVEHKLGLVTVDRINGKPSETQFELFSTDGKESVVKCRPLTGRTHQIRVHLRHLGYPIVNDHLYNNAIWPAETPDPDSAQLKGIARTLLDEMVARDGDAFDEALDKDAVCPECVMERPDPTPEQLCIYLHAYRYSCSAWAFETALPEWTKLANIELEQ
jgi:tRNA pseudouridine synthase 9